MIPSYRSPARIHRAMMTLCVALFIRAMPSAAQSPASHAAAKVSMRTARRAALALEPGGRIRRARLERENGRLLYAFDIATPGKAGVDRVQIDAVTGARIGAVERESTKDEPTVPRSDARQMKPDTKSNRRHTIPVKPDVVLKPEAASR